MPPFSVLQGAVTFLRIILQALLIENPNHVVTDFNGNNYPVSSILNSGNNQLLNGIFYWDPDAKKITYCATTPGLPQPLPINGWVSAIAGPNGTPAYQLPAPVSGQVEPHLYRLFS